MRECRPYSGCVYGALAFPRDAHPIFACARMAGWSAHRFEEIVSGKRIMRPLTKDGMPARIRAMAVARLKILHG
ncbi:MAG: citrate/2-methylcitrate synthase [Eggerthellaceae bacterium]